MAEIGGRTLEMLAMALLMMGTFGVAEAAAAQTMPAETIAYASRSGAALDTDLLNGGGHDDTDALQKLLDRARNGQPVHLIVDGPALVSGLDVYGHSTVECTAGGGFFLKDGSVRAILRNAHRSRGPINDNEIAVRGCFFNGNREHQIGPNGATPNQEADKSYLSGLQFLGVSNLAFESITLWKVRGFALQIANGRNIRLTNIRIDNGNAADVAAMTAKDRGRLWQQFANTDGVHLNGPLQYVTIRGLELHTGDDALAFNANDGDSGRDDVTIGNEMGPYVGQGPIMDVTASDIVLMNATLGIRFYSSNQRIDRIVISNVVGTVQQRMAVLGHHTTPSPKGNFGSIIFNNVMVDPVATPSATEMFSLSKEAQQWGWRNMPDLMTYALFAIDSPIESLSLRYVSIHPIDHRPIVWIGKDADVRRMTVDLDIVDPKRLATPFAIAAGGRVGHATVALDWNASRRKAISNSGGTVERWQWVPERR